MAAPTTTQARPWSPDLTHSDRERWICIYPAYINSRKTLAEGRRIPKNRAVDNPTYSEMRDVCAAAGLVLGVENKVYSREKDPKALMYRGRLRIHLKNDDGTPVNDHFPTRKSVLYHLGDTIPKLKARVQSQAAQGQSQAPAGGSKKKRGRK